MQISDKNIISMQPIVLELKDEVLVNSMSYDINSLNMLNKNTPIFSNHTDYTNYWKTPFIKKLFLNKYSDVSYNGKFNYHNITHKSTECMQISDEQYTYQIMTNGYYHGIICVKIDNKTNEIISDNRFWISRDDGERISLSILGQCERYIYLKATGTYGYRGGIVYIDKLTCSSYAFGASTRKDNTMLIKKIYETYDRIFFTRGITYQGSSKVCYINKMHKTTAEGGVAFKYIELPTTLTFSGTSSCMPVEDAIIQVDDDTIMAVGCSFEKEGLRIHRRDLSISSMDTLSESSIIKYECIPNIDWNGFEDGFSMLNKCAVATKYPFISIFGNNIDGKIYFSVVSYQNAVSADEYTEGSGLWNFEVVDDTTIRLVSRLRLPSDIRPPITNDDNTRMYIPSLSGVYMLSRNDRTGDYSIFNTVNIAPSSIGLDKTERLWVLAESGDIHVFDDRSISRVDIRFENESLAYVGEKLSNNILLSIYNVNENRMLADVRLTLTGDATFDGTSKVVDVKTSLTEDVCVPIEITGPGRIQVNPSVRLINDGDSFSNK